MGINTTPTAPVTLNGDPPEFVEDFTYLGSLIRNTIEPIKTSKQDGCVFAKLEKIWKSKQYTMQTHLRLYKSNMKSILLCGSECWRVVKRNMAKIDSVPEFTDLGSTLSSNGCINDKIQRRMANANLTFDRLRHRLLNNHYVSMRVNVFRFNLRKQAFATTWQQ